MRTALWDRYREDSQFVQQTASLVPVEQRILVLDDDAPLNASWLLFYLKDRATMLHNVTFLRVDDLPEKEVFLIARQKQEKFLADYGTFDVVLQSRQSRDETGPQDRYALYRLRFHPNLERVRGPVPINPMQATGRSTGLFCNNGRANAVIGCLLNEHETRP